MSYAVIAETNTQRAMCQRVSNFFSCNAILVATCTCTFIPSWNTKESTVWFQMKKKCSSCRLLLAVKKDRRYRFFSNFQKLLHVSCTLILLKQKQLISKRISIVQLCFTDLSNNLFKVCLMPIHCAVFMRDLRIFSFSFYLDWKPVWAVFLKILFATKTCYM